MSRVEPTETREPQPNVAARRDIDGIVLLDKPIGLSSNQALQVVRRLYRANKAGHTGSLDPLATGMLPICLGQATKVCGFLLGSDKLYEFRVRFGVRTSTGDLEGQEVERGPATVGMGSLQAVVAGLVGPHQQVPPMHSALKHQGKPLYRLARAGLEIERAPREVWIRELTILEPHSSEPHLMVRCSKGTYIRSLAEEIARRAGTVGHLVSLRRLAVAPFAEREMVSLDDLRNAAEGGLGALDRILTPIEAAVSGYPAVHLAADEGRRICNGQRLDRGAGLPPGPVRLFDERLRFLGMGEYRADGGLIPLRLMAGMPVSGQPQKSGL